MMMKKEIFKFSAHSFCAFSAVAFLFLAQPVSADSTAQYVMPGAQAADYSSMSQEEVEDMVRQQVYEQEEMLLQAGDVDASVNHSNGSSVPLSGVLEGAAEETNKIYRYDNPKSELFNRALTPERTFHNIDYPY